MNLESNSLVATMAAPKLSPDCSICCDKFTKAKRAPVACPKCGFRICSECLQKYIMASESLTQIQCVVPECDCVWERSFLAEHLTQVFMRKRYPKRRGELLYQHALSRMPETMPWVERQKEAYILKEQKALLREEIMKCKKFLQQCREKEWRLDRKIRHVLNGNPANEEKQKNREFIQPCPGKDCRGFLSSQWKCKVCNLLVCSKCHEIKNVSEQHNCDGDILKTVEMLKRDTKGCPACGVPIHKIDGCDQMWCTQCQVAFSWRTGRRINGVIHNPHFYQWQRENGPAPRVHGDVRCGGFPRYYHLRQHTNAWRRGVDRRFREDGITTHEKECLDRLYHLHRQIEHFRQQEIPRWRGNAEMDENARERVDRNIRVCFIMGEIGVENMKTRLAARDIKRTRARDIFHVFQLLQTIATERFIAVCQNPCVTTGDRCYNDCHQVREYCNNELKKISATDGLTVPIIQENFWCAGAKFSKKDVGW